MHYTQHSLTRELVVIGSDTLGDGVLQRTDRR
jgi:hypothetical protein